MMTPQQRRASRRQTGMQPLPQRPGPTLARGPRARLEAVIDKLIDALDELDGDVDLEVDDEDCCTAYDDDPACMLDDGKPGDPEDAEIDDEPEDEHDREEVV